MGKHEHRLRIMPEQANISGSMFMTRSLTDRRDKGLFLCGSCSILFADASISTIVAGTAGRCTNCGAVNQL